jgi:hypothetical protein
MTSTQVCGSDRCAGPLTQLGILGSAPAATPVMDEVTSSQPEPIPNTGSDLFAQPGVFPSVEGQTNFLPMIAGTK